MKFTRQRVWGKTRHLRLCYFQLRLGVFSRHKQMSSPSGRAKIWMKIYSFIEEVFFSADIRNGGGDYHGGEDRGILNYLLHGFELDATDEMSNKIHDVPRGTGHLFGVYGEKTRIVTGNNRAANDGIIPSIDGQIPPAVPLSARRPPHGALRQSPTEYSV